MIRPVFSDANHEVENIQISAAHAITVHQRSSRLIPKETRARCDSRSLLVMSATRDPLFDAVVGCFARDDYVVNVALAQAGGRNAHEVAALLEFIQICHAAVAHAAAQAADELIDEAGERTFIGDLSFDSFGDGLAALCTFLAIAIR